MFKNIKRLIGDKDYSTFMKAVKILMLDAICHAFVYSTLFLMLTDLINQTVSYKKISIYSLLIIIMIYVRYKVLRKGNFIAFANGAEIIANLRIKMGDHIKKLNMGYFSKNNVGELTNILSNDLNDFEMLITHHMPELVKHFILMLYLSIYLIFFDTYLGGIQSGTLFIIFPISYFCSKKIKEVGKRAKKVRAKMLARIMEYSAGIEVFKTYNMTGERFNKLEKALNDVKKESINVELSGVPYILPMHIFSLVMYPVVLYIASQRYFNGAMSIQSLIMFVVISLAFTSVELNFSTVFVISRYFMLSVDKLLSVLDTEEISYKVDDYKFSNYNIEFKDVYFSYIKDKEVLKNINFTAKEGEMTALIGKSGSGKTTVLNLIARFFDVDSGEIKIGDYNIKNIYPDSLLKNISMVFQDVYLIQDTIYENIKIGKIDATEEEIIEAAKMANCHEFIEKLEDGYNTYVHEGGTTLSGGEKQRISIARAFLKNAPIILLDEATASLDVDNEHIIQKSIRNLIKGKTVIVIAHRLNTIKDAAQIIVFDKGEIVEKGKHEELILLNGEYKKMYTTMLEVKEIEFLKE
ncbi:ABC transporter ATP-binding protein [Fusobacterium russii]|uniref:ABC transporter ATP-binding protein n=1 Tax=Fusobacterium russii TaxID=854 RepID=UPI0003A66CBC|nr:ABC transporter ATP-binding protein [Fusobacterium russii]